MALFEGLDDVVASEYERLRSELKAAITESRYTMGQIAALADVGESTLRHILNKGAHSAQIDTLMRVAFVVGARIEIARPDEQGARPFEVVPVAPASTGSLRSISSSSRSATGADTTPRKSRTSAKKAGKQRGKSSAVVVAYPRINRLGRLAA